MSSARAALAPFLDPFLWGLFGAMALAVLFPGLGRTGGPLHAERLADVGIATIFLLHGVGLEPSRLASAALQIRLHLFVQAFTFGVFPLLWWAGDAIGGGLFPTELRLGFLFLCAVPSTVSSSVALTAVARGNVPGAIWNASLSSVLGVVLTPLLVRLLGDLGEPGAQEVGAIPLGPAILRLGGLTLLPLLAGQLLRPLLGRARQKVVRVTHGFDRAVILLLVFVAFAESVGSGMFGQVGLATLGGTFAAAALLLATVLLLSTVAARRLGFSREDEIAAVFCGSKKTLASGVPIAGILFGASGGAGLIVLPLILYHQIQLVVCAVLAARYAERKDR